MRGKGLICILTVASLAAAASCSKVKPSYNRENLKATWVADVYDGTLADPSKWTVQTFEDNSKLTLYGIKENGDGNRIWDKCELSYEAYCCDMSYSGTVDGFFGIPVSARIYREYAFTSSEDSTVTLEITYDRLNGEQVYSDYNRLTMRKLPTKYPATDSLTGIWQTYTRDGEQFESWRLMFETSNKFTLSVQNDAGFWTEVGEGTDVYYPYSDFITITVKDNPYLGTPDFSDVAFLSELTAMPKASFMSFVFKDNLYTLTYISSL